MSLLRAAFSHNAFAQDWRRGRDGAYRKVVTSGMVDGPVVITHTRHDVAVGIAYAMASRIAGQQDSAIGDASSTYGGLGSNGAQHTPEAVDGRLRRVGSAYDLERGRLHNLLADEFVSGHSDVSGPGSRRRCGRPCSPAEHLETRDAIGTMWLSAGHRGRDPRAGARTGCGGRSDRTDLAPRIRGLP